jgi:urea transport system substrate-binding protein
MSSTEGTGSQPVARREFLQSGGVAATLAAVRSLAPALFVGCSVGLPKQASTVPIGLLHSQTGTMAISEASVRDAELFACEQINAAGGILGRMIEVQAPDTRSRADLFPKRAQEMIDAGVVALFGCWTSASRKAMLPVLEESDRLLFYPVAHEGNESSPQVIYGGSVPNQQVLPAIDWLVSAEGGFRRRIFLLGSDYVYPRTTNYIVKKYLETKPMVVVGQRYLPLGERNFQEAVREILASEADCVLNTVNGDSNLGLFTDLAAAGIDPQRVPMVSTSVAEDELRNLLPENVAGHYAVSCYFQSLPATANREWVTAFRREFGFDRVTGDPMEPAWCLLHLWKEAVEKAGSFATEDVRAALRDGLGYDGPGGMIRIDPKTQYCTKYFRLGRIRRDRQFDIVRESAGPLAPEPYPQFAFPGWKCDWTQGGLVRGEEVRIDGNI